MVSKNPEKSSGAALGKPRRGPRALRRRETIPELRGNIWQPVDRPAGGVVLLADQDGSGRQPNGGAAGGRGGNPQPGGPAAALAGRQQQGGSAAARAGRALADNGRRARMQAPVQPFPETTPASVPDLRRLTAARIALGHVGISLPTGAHLDFQLAHARARDAVHHALDIDGAREALQVLGQPVICLHSRAQTRAEYLRRPDQGRRLDEASCKMLLEFAATSAGETGDAPQWAASSQPRENPRGQVEPASTSASLASKTSTFTPASDATSFPKEAQSEDGPPDVLFVVADGLSSIAIERNAVPLLQEILPMLREDGLRVGPLALVKHGRVAIGDEIAECLHAPLVVMLIGERPGLSSPDSMGIYLTWNARVGTTDEARNCISNVRAEGLPHAAAAARLRYLIREARRRRMSGVALKDESGPAGAAVLQDAPEKPGLLAQE